MNDMSPQNFNLFLFYTSERSQFSKIVMKPVLPEEKRLLVLNILTRSLITDWVLNFADSILFGGTVKP